MADIDTSTWSETAASNNASPADGWPEGQSYASVNNCAREMMGALKREWNRSHGTLASGGTGTAMTLTFTTAPGAYVQGMRFAWRAAGDCGASPTLNVNALGAKALKRLGPGGLLALVAKDIRAGQIIEAVYDSSADAMIVLTPDSRVGWRLIQTQAFAVATTLVFALPATLYGRFRLVVSGAVRSGGNAAVLGLQVSSDGAVSYEADYFVGGTFTGPVNGGTSYTTSGSASSTAPIFSDFQANNTVQAEVDITAIQDVRFHAVSSGARYNGGSPYFCYEQIASIAASSATPDHLRILWNDAANFIAQGSCSLYGYNEGA